VIGKAIALDLAKTLALNIQDGVLLERVAEDSSYST